MNQQERIRLFVDAHVFDDEFQGSRTFLKEIYSIIAGMEGVCLYMAAFDTENLCRLFPPSDHVVILKYRRRSGWFRLLLDIPFLIRKHRIDYAHFQYITPPIKNCKQVVTVHDVIFKDYPDEFALPYRIIKKFLYKTSALRSDIITTVSAFSRESIEKFLHTGKRPVYVIPNGVHPRFFEPYDKEAAKEMVARKYGFGKFILYVSRIEPRKNHILLLKAWLELQFYREGYQLVLVGHESIAVPEFDDFYNGLPDEARKYVFRVRDIPDEDLPLIYRAAELFVYPSKAEGFGIPPLEAAAVGTPVLCSNTSAMRDFSFFGAYHFDPYDYAQFKQKVKRVLEEPPTAAFLAEVAGIIRKEYSWRHSAEKLVSLLTQNKKVIP